MSRQFTLVSLEQVAVHSILELLRGSLSTTGATAKSAEFWRWKHLDNPFGRSLGLAALDASSGALVGVRPLMQWRLRDRDGTLLRAVRPVDTVTHPDWRGVGIFSELTEKSVSELDGRVYSLVFNTPNANSLPGYEKLGWNCDIQLPIQLSVLRPLPLLLKLLSGQPTASGAQSWDTASRGGVVTMREIAKPGLEKAIEFAAGCESRQPFCGYRTARDERYLHWRYVDHPNVDYGVFTVHDDAAELAALAILRLDSRKSASGAVLVDVFPRDLPVASFRGLVRAIKKDLTVDYLLAHFPRDSAQASALRRLLFITPRTMTLAVREAADHKATYTAALLENNWDLSFSDLEVF